MSYVCRMKTFKMEKRVEIKMTDDLYEQIIKFCNQYSHSPSAGIRLLIKGQLNAIAQKNGLASEILLPPDVKLLLQEVMPDAYPINDYIVHVLMGHIKYMKGRSENKGGYGDTKYESKESFNQDNSQEITNPLLKSMGWGKKK